NNYIKEIGKLKQEKAYSKAYNLAQEALESHPDNTFLLSNEIFLLYKLNKIKAAYQKAKQHIDTLRDNPLFARTYIIILDKLALKQELEELIDHYTLFMKITDQEFYLFLANKADYLLVCLCVVLLFDRRLLSYLVYIAGIFR
ncbi:hypothetical protein MCHI_001645, partial [Candidatus Magnetoovum chiemensis]